MLRLVGIASTPDVDVDGDAIMAGALDVSIREKGAANIPLLVLHNYEARAGRIVTLRRFGDILAVEAMIDPTAPGVSDYLESYRSVGLGLSVGLRDGFESETKDGVRVISRARLVELSLTPVPANRRCAVTYIEGITP